MGSRSSGGLSVARDLETQAPNCHRYQLVRIEVQQVDAISHRAQGGPAARKVLRGNFVRGLKAEHRILLDIK